MSLDMFIGVLGNREVAVTVETDNLGVMRVSIAERDYPIDMWGPPEDLVAVRQRPR
jgi:hypothetical protein